MVYIVSVLAMNESTMFLTIGGFEPATSYTKTDCLTYCTKRTQLARWVEGTREAFRETCIRQSVLV